MPRVCGLRCHHGHGVVSSLKLVLSCTSVRGGLLHNECYRAYSLDVLHTSQQPTKSLEVSQCDLWDRHARSDARHWCFLAHCGCLWFPESLYLCGLHGSNLECPRTTRPRPCFPFFGLPLQVGQLVVWSSSVDQRTTDRPAHCACY